MPHKGKTSGTWGFIEMLEQMLQRDNLNQAYKRVVQNKGSNGGDGVPTSELKAQISEHWSTTQRQLLDGTYDPFPVHRVEIPKPNGGNRKLGIPTVMDRLIQQAMNLYLQRIYDPTFPSYSYGFRPGKRAHDAIGQAQTYMNQGYNWVVDIDLEKFFEVKGHSETKYDDILEANNSEVVLDPGQLKSVVKKYFKE